MKSFCAYVLCIRRTRIRRRKGAIDRYILLNGRVAPLKAARIIVQLSYSRAKNIHSHRFPSTKSRFKSDVIPFRKAENWIRPTN